VKTAGVALCLACAASACNPKPPSDDDYAARIEAARASKDSFLGTGKDSPVPESRRSHFLPLEYFDIDPAFKLPAKLIPPTTDEVIDMPTSTGTIDKMRRAGTLEFVLEGRPLKLSAFMSAASGVLFVPFRDTTAGEETYSAGRYLEIERSPSGVYELDFNRAFNPYCYFNIVYVCPLPPRENHLPVAIRAGERVKNGVKG
jgi:uncharacterized protein (DUF1684 family)